MFPINDFECLFLNFYLIYGDSIIYVANRKNIPLCDVEGNFNWSLCQFICDKETDDCLERILL